MINVGCYPATADGYNVPSVYRRIIIYFIRPREGNANLPIG